jgi:hypothetical protein
MDGQSKRSDIDDTDYDGSNGKRWYYRLYCDLAGRWFWEPGLPTPAEIAAPHTYRRVSWEPVILTEAEWPSQSIRGPYTHRGKAIAVAEEWFDAARETRS